MSASLEKIVYDFLKALVEAAEDGDVLRGAQVSENTYEAVSKVKCIQIGPCESEPAPAPQAEEMTEFDGMLTLVILRKVADKANPHSFTEAREEALDIARAIGVAIANDQDLSGALQLALTKKVRRTFTTVGNHPHALANLDLILNPTGDNIQ